MEKTLKSEKIFSKEYWQSAVKNFGNTKILVFAALIIALRVAVKALRIPVAAGLYITFDCYVNALGSMIYGPVVALAAGAVSDTLGCLLFPSGPYFFPFIFVEMSSSFIFALFFWKRKITVAKAVLAKFTVNLICNILLTSVIMKWDYYVFYGLEKAEAYNIINLARIAKNLIMFPLEALLIFIVLSALMPAFVSMKLIKDEYRSKEKIKTAHIILVISLLLLSVLLVLFYIFYLKDFISAHNFKFL